jgi:hypothetical protein
MTNGTIRITAATPEESSSIYRFYCEQANSNILPRPETELRKSAEDGLFFKGDCSGQLVAVAGVFSLGKIPYAELGGTFVAEDVRGYGLQRLLFQLRIAATVANLGANYQMLTAIDPTNPISRLNALQTGFEPWQKPISEMFDPCLGCSKRGLAQQSFRQCCCDFFILPTNRAQGEVRHLLESTRQTGMVNRRRRGGDETLSVALDQLDLITKGARVDLINFVSDVEE